MPPRQSERSRATSDRGQLLYPSDVLIRAPGAPSMSERPTSNLPPDPSGTSLAWVKPYYTRAGEYWGPTGIEQKHQDRLAALTRLCGPPPRRVLELGAGTGEASAVMAD